VSVDVHQGDQEGLDRTRRYLRPVAEYDTDETHLSVYAWLPAFEAWATGMSLCGGSMRQGPLPEGTVVSCQGCLGYQPKYERYLAPGYDPADDDPEVLRARMETAERQVAAARKFAGEMRDFCSPHGVATDYADRLVEAMDRAKGEPHNTAADALAAEWHRRNRRLEELTKSKGPEAQVAIVEHVRGELVGLRGALGVLLGGQVKGGTADLLGWAYCQEWRRRQEGKA
jgi:hypothetical protein